MSIARPIIIIEDDLDDQEIAQNIIDELDIANKIIFFENGRSAIDYLMTTQDRPFIIISDMNLPGLSGLEVKKQIDDNEYLREKCIPFIFISTSANKQAVETAYTNLNVQGYFEKGHNYEQYKGIFKLIFDYWKVCKHPNSD